MSKTLRLEVHAENSLLGVNRLVNCVYETAVWVPSLPDECRFGQPRPRIDVVEEFPDVDSKEITHNEKSPTMNRNPLPARMPSMKERPCPVSYVGANESTPVTSQSSDRRRSHKWEPMKPAAPVTRA